MSDPFENPKFFAKLSDAKAQSQTPPHHSGLNARGTFVMYGGGTIGSVVRGTAIVGVGQEMTHAYAVAEDHMHDQQRWQPQPSQARTG